jgi:TolB-like protein
VAKKAWVSDVRGRLSSVALVLGLAWFPVPALATAKDKPVLVILPFESPRSSDARELGANAVEYFTVQMVEAKKVRVVERAKLDRVLKEHELNMSGFVDPASIKRALGKGLAADFAVLGRIADMGDAYSLSARLVNLESAEMESAKEVTFRDLSSLRVAVKVLTKNFLGDITGEKLTAGAAEGMLATDPKHFYSAAELLTEHLMRLVPLVEGEVNEIDPDAKTVIVGAKRAFSDVPLGTRLEVFRNEVNGNNKVGEIFVSRVEPGESTLTAAFLKKSLGDTLQMGDTVSTKKYKARVGIGKIVDEAEDNDALVARFRDTVSERLGDMERMGTVDYGALGDSLLAASGAGKDKAMKDLHKKGVDFVVTGKFYGRPGDRRTDFKVYNAYTGKIAVEVKMDTRL